MNDESQVSLEDSEARQIDETIHVVQETIAKFLEAADVDAVYGKPVQNGETLILPAAEVLSGLGFGMGYGGGSEQLEEGEAAAGPTRRGVGGGGGGGGRVFSRPVAVVVATPQGVRVEPVIDVSKLALAALTAAGFMFGMLVKMTRLPRPTAE